MPGKLTLGASLLCVVTSFVFATEAMASDKPKLVLQITVDQLRGDLPTLTAAIGAKPPSGAAGEVLLEVLGQ